MEPAGLPPTLPPGEKKSLDQMIQSASKFYAAGIDFGGLDTELPKTVKGTGTLYHSTQAPPSRPSFNGIALNSVAARVSLFVFAALALQGCGSDNKPTSAPTHAPTPAPMLAQRTGIMAAAVVKQAVSKAGADLLGHGFCTTGIYKSATGSASSCAAKCATDANCNFFTLLQSEPPTCTFHDSYSCNSRVQNPANPDFYLTFVSKRGLAKEKAAMAKVGIELLGPGYCTLGVYRTTTGTATSCATKCSTDAKCNFFSFLPSVRMGSLPTCTFHDSHSCDSRVQNPTIPDVYLTFIKKGLSMRETTSKGEKFNSCPLLRLCLTFTGMV